jgi:hypothetical protein
VAGATALRSPARHQLLIGYIKQTWLAISSNGVSGAFGTSSASGYILNFLFIFVVFIASTICYARISVMIYLMFWIKMNRNLALIPTQTTFAFALPPNHLMSKLYICSMQFCNLHYHATIFCY